MPGLKIEEWSYLGRSFSDLQSIMQYTICCIPYTICHAANTIYYVLRPPIVDYVLHIILYRLYYRLYNSYCILPMLYYTLCTTYYHILYTIYYRPSQIFMDWRLLKDPPRNLQSSIFNPPNFKKFSSNLKIVNFLPK